MSKVKEIIQEFEQKSKRIVASIEEKIGFHESGLIKAAPDDPLVDSFENLSLALAYFTQGDKERFNFLVAGVKRLIGFNSEGFLINKLEGDKVFTSDQALLSICLQYLDKKAAKNSAEKILSFIDKDKWLVFNGQGDTQTYTFNFILAMEALAEAGYWEEAALIRNSLFQRLQFTKNGLALGIPGRKISRSRSEKGIFTIDNMLLAHHYCSPVKIKKAIKIVQTVNQQIGYDSESGLYYRSKTDQRLYTYVNAIAAYTLKCLANVLPFYHKFLNAEL